MSENLHEEIYSHLSQKDSEELLNIWVTNNRSVWATEAFVVIEEILKQRDVEIPLQGPPITEEPENLDSIYNPDDFTAEERKILEDENPPEFYDPFEVLKISRGLKFLATIMAGFIVLVNASQYSKIIGSVHAYFTNFSVPILEAYITISIITINIFIRVSVTYISLIALSKILRILMEMEFNSRKSK